MLAPVAGRRGSAAPPARARASARRARRLKQRDIRRATFECHAGPARGGGRRAASTAAEGSHAASRTSRASGGGVYAAFEPCGGTHRHVPRTLAEAGALPVAPTNCRGDESPATPRDWWSSRLERPSRARGGGVAYLVGAAAGLREDAPAGRRRGAARRGAGVLLHVRERRPPLSPGTPTPPCPRSRAACRARGRTRAVSGLTAGGAVVETRAPTRAALLRKYSHRKLSLVMRRARRASSNASRSGGH